MATLFSYGNRLQLLQHFATKKEKTKSLHCGVDGQTDLDGGTGSGDEIKALVMAAETTICPHTHNNSNQR